MRVVGLDPSLTNTGVVLLDGDQLVNHFTVKTKRGTIPARYFYIEQMIGLALREFRPEVVGIERYLTGKESSEDLYAVQVMLQVLCLQFQCRLLLALPNQWRSIAYGRHEAKRAEKGIDGDLDLLESRLEDKQSIMRRMREETGCGRVNSHEADAYFMARVTQRFFLYADGKLAVSELTASERYIFDRPSSKKELFGEDEVPVREGILHKRNTAWFDFRGGDAKRLLVDTLTESKRR